MMIASHDLHSERKSNFPVVEGEGRDTITNQYESTIKGSIQSKGDIIDSAMNPFDYSFGFNLNVFSSDTMISTTSLGEAEDLQCTSFSNGNCLKSSEISGEASLGCHTPIDNLFERSKSISLCDEASSFSMLPLEKKPVPYFFCNAASTDNDSHDSSLNCDSPTEESNIISADMTATHTTKHGVLKPAYHGSSSTPPRKNCSNSGDFVKNSTLSANFATPLAPISPYKTFKQDRMAREREANIRMNTSMSSVETKTTCSMNRANPPDKLAAVSNDPPSTRSCGEISSSTDLSWSAMMFGLLAYLCILVASCCSAVLPSADHSDTVLHSPWVGENNATKLIDQRLLLIQSRYQKVLVRDDWKMLRMSPNVTIETMSSEDGSWPGYIRTCAIFQAQPADILKHLGWLQYDETQKIVDRFHESAHLLFAPSHKSKVIRKTTQRPLLFPKREMTVALCEKTLKHAFTLTNLRLRTAPMKTFTSILIPKGTQMNAMVNVNVDLDALEFPVKNPFWRRFDNKNSEKGKNLVQSRKVWQTKRDRKEKHIKAYQDMMGWFVELKGGGTLLVFVMQVDLGPDIPHWAFFTAVAATAAWSMAALNKLSRKDV